MQLQLKKIVARLVHVSTGKFFAQAGRRYHVIPVLAWLAISTATADTLTFARSDAGTILGPPWAGVSHSQNDNDSSLNGANISVSAFSQQGEATASADSVAQLGFLRGAAFLTYPVLNDGSATSDFNALWQDTFLINVAGRTGETAFFEAASLVHGFVDATGTAQIYVVVSADMNGLNQSNLIIHFAPSHPEQTTNELPGGTGVLPIAGSFTIGVPFTLRVSLSGFINRYGTGSGYGDNGAGSGDIQFGNTVAWAGIKSVALSDGTVVSDYTFQSGSGVDFRPSFVGDPGSPVPEPSTYLFSVVGLTFIALVEAPWLRGARRRFKLSY